MTTQYAFRNHEDDIKKSFISDMIVLWKQAEMMVDLYDRGLLNADKMTTMIQQLSRIIEMYTIPATPTVNTTEDN